MLFSAPPVDCVRVYGTYDYSLVTLSYIVAVFASFIALDIASRFKDVNNTLLINIAWLLGGSFAMGAGIWSMHFIGMLAFKMTMPMTFNPYWTLASIIAALVASFIALNLLRTNNSFLQRYIVGGLVIGLGIAIMHYLGMEAMTDTMQIKYNIVPFVVSIVIAIVASDAALYLAMAASEIWIKHKFILKILSALVMGAAICGMHYMGMYAAEFSMKIPTGKDYATIDPDYLSKIVSFVSLSILMIAFLISRYREKQNQHLVSRAIEVGRSEVVVNILHNVGNVLNSINVSANIINEKNLEISSVSLSPIINNLIENKDNLVDYLHQNNRLDKLIQFMQGIEQANKELTSSLNNETQSLLKNVSHVKAIIQSQQTFNKVNEIIEVVSVKELIDEAIHLVFTNEDMSMVTFNKVFVGVNTIQVNKTKLMQILVNLIKNAKEAIADASIQNGAISIEVASAVPNIISFTVGDNGIGIARENISKIYQHGFSTKPDGNGFGLHSCSLLVKELKGTLEVISNVPQSGTRFVVTVPYKFV